MTGLLTFRDARADEQLILFNMVLSNQLNVMDVQWRNFIVAVDSNDEIVGCGQIKRYGEVSELASLVVNESRRGQGVSNLLMEALLDRGGRPLWLACESSLTGYYSKFGFLEEKQPRQLPLYFRPAYWASRTAFSAVFMMRGTYLAFMVRT